LFFLLVIFFPSPQEKMAKELVKERMKENLNRLSRGKIGEQESKKMIDSLFSFAPHLSLSSKEAKLPINYQRSTSSTLERIEETDEENEEKKEEKREQKESDINQPSSAKSNKRKEQSSSSSKIINKGEKKKKVKRYKRGEPDMRGFSKEEIKLIKRRVRRTEKELSILHALQEKIQTNFAEEISKLFLSQSFILVFNQAFHKKAKSDADNRDSYTGYYYENLAADLQQASPSLLQQNEEESGRTIVEIIYAFGENGMTTELFASLKPSPQEFIVLMEEILKVKLPEIDPLRRQLAIENYLKFRF
jgi:hypothetical protein